MEDEEEPAPEVPVRRSSRATDRQQHRPHHQQPQPPPPQPQRFQRESKRYEEEDDDDDSFDPRRELPRPLLTNEPEGWRSSRARPADKRRAISRPTQPPPPPPLPAAAGRARPKSLAPKNIWSPSSSSVTTGSLSASTPDGTPEQLSSDQQAAPPMAVKSIAITNIDHHIMSSPSSQNTIVERRLHLVEGGSDGESCVPAPGEQVLNQQTSRTNQQNDVDDDDDDGNNISGGSNQHVTRGSSELRAVPASSSSSLPSPLVASNSTEATTITTRQGERGEATPDVERQPPASDHDDEFERSQRSQRTAGCRSMSVSVRRPTDAATAAAASAVAASVNASGRQLANLRSFSIATSTLPGAGAGSARGRPQQQSSSSAAEQASKYWTLPSGSAAAAATEAESTATAIPTKPATSNSEATLAERPTQQQQEQQQQQQQQLVLKQEEEQLYSTSSKRKSADVAARQKQPKQKQQELDHQHQQYQLKRGQPDETTTKTTTMEQQADEAKHQTQSESLAGRKSLASFESRPQQQQQPNGSARDEWFRHMYKQMHKPTPENSLLKAVNSQPIDTLRDHIEIKLKSPKRGEFLLYFSHVFSPENRC